LPEGLQINPEPAPTRSHSRRAKGECGQRLARNIERVLEEIRSAVDSPQLEVVPLDAGAGDVSEVVMSDAGAAEVTAEPSPFDGDSAWSLLCAVPDFAPSDLKELSSASSALDQHPEMQSIAFVAAITRAKLTMNGISSWSKPDAPIEIGAGDLLILLKSALHGVH
tara:strand:+ start:110 stop:607 length:498 start_codon:yes stop_codon:yes gene_type:complete